LRFVQLTEAILYQIDFSANDSMILSEKRLVKQKMFFFVIYQQPLIYNFEQMSEIVDESKFKPVTLKAILQ